MKGPAVAPDTPSEVQRMSDHSVHHSVHHSVSHSVAILLSALLLGSPVTAEQTSSGTAVIRGRVIAADTGEPIYGATIRVASEETARTGFTRAERTDDRGRYEITGLAAGRYVLLAYPPGDRAMYLQTERQVSGAPAVLDLEYGRILTDVDFALPRAGAISGQVVDAYGRPLAGMSVRVLARTFAGLLSRPPLPSTLSLSDDYGRYRAWGLPPGGYYVLVEPGTRSAGYPTGPAGETYVRTFYPNVTSLSAASAIKLRPSEEIGNADIRVAWSRTFNLNGVVLGGAGRPALGADVRLDLADDRGSQNTYRATTDADGRFTFERLTPGDYVLDARAATPTGGAPAVARPQRLTIAGTDVDDVSLVLHSGITLSGAIVTDIGAPPPFAPDGIQVHALATDIVEQALVPRVPGRVPGDWTFELPGILVPVRIRVRGLPKGWFVRAVMHRGQDVSDTPTDFFAVGDTGGLKVIVTDRGAVLAGTVEDAAGRPAVLRMIWLVPNNSIADPTSASGTRGTLSDEDGRFELAGVPPGRYLVVAVDGRRGERPDLGALAEIATLGTPITLAEQERKEIRLRLVAWPY